ncbi:hypothetical protein O5D80_002216 [Batrachochytrium dendrobatidis]|nr:hypothetical protein O5D80_002216 [Batrachochytrium dendrobatidis]
MLSSICLFANHLIQTATNMVLESPKRCFQHAGGSSSISFEDGVDNEKKSMLVASEPIAINRESASSQIGSDLNPHSSPRQVNRMRAQLSSIVFGEQDTVASERLATGNATRPTLAASTNSENMSNTPNYSQHSTRRYPPGGHSSITLGTDPIVWPERQAPPAFPLTSPIQSVSVPQSMHKSSIIFGDAGKQPPDRLYSQRLFPYKTANDTMKFNDFSDHHDNMSKVDRTSARLDPATFDHAAGRRSDHQHRC